MLIRLITLSNSCLWTLGYPFLKALMAIESFHNGLDLGTARICGHHILVEAGIIRWLHISELSVDGNICQRRLCANGKSLRARKSDLQFLEVSRQVFLEPFLVRLLVAEG